MNEALCSILSGEKEWCFDQDGRTITFNKDGTGELWCRCNFNYWIAADIEWKSIEPRDHVESPNQITEIANVDQKKSPYLLGQIDVEITLTKRLPERFKDLVLSTSTIINELCLEEAAFRPKSYTIRIENGNFIEPCSIGQKDPYNPSRYSLRLLFDKSPYPPRSEWMRPEEGPDGGPFWEHKEFVGRNPPEIEQKVKAMNDIPESWNTCMVS